MVPFTSTRLLAYSLFLVLIPLQTLLAQNSPQLLVFTKTAGFRHSSIPDAIKAMGTLAETHSWTLAYTEDSSEFTTDNLSRFKAVVWLLTSGDVLNAKQESAFEQFVKSGGGYVGVHSASDTEYSWGFYGSLVGAYFSGHPAVQSGEIVVEELCHPATLNLPNPWERVDEWYTFQDNPRERVNVLYTIDESSYNSSGFEMGDHPLAWYQNVGKGRAFYTALGHTSASYSEAVFLEHISGAINWVLKRRAALPDSCNRTSQMLFASGFRPTKPSVKGRGRKRLVSLEAFEVPISYRVRIIRPGTHRRKRNRNVDSATARLRLPPQSLIQYRVLLADGERTRFSRRTRVSNRR